MSRVTQEIEGRLDQEDKKEARASMELKVVLENVNAHQVEGTRVLPDLPDQLVSQAFQVDLELKVFREIWDEKVTRVPEDHKAFKEFLVLKVKRVRKETLMVSALQVQRVTQESLDFLVLVEGQVVQDQMVSLVPWGTPDSRVLGMQGHEVQKVNQVYLEL